MSIWDVLDPGCTYKKWKVNVSSYSSGHFKNFWFKKNALKYANGYKDSQYWVDLENNITEKSVRINDPQAKKKDPSCKHKWNIRGQGRWWCSECNAQFNMSCEHGRSMACAECVELWIKDVESKGQSWEKYLAEHSW